MYINFDVKQLKIDTNSYQDSIVICVKLRTYLKYLRFIQWATLKTLAENSPIITQYTYVHT